MIAVDTKSGTTGLISLNWAYKSSGVFRWATEDEDVQDGAAALSNVGDGKCHAHGE